MATKTKVTIVVLNYNGKDDTLECLETLEKLVQEKIAIDTIVVDNCSTDGSQAAIRKSFPKVTLIENKSNLGFSEGNNVGIKKALKNNADFIFILNNDTLAHPLLAEELVKTAQNKEAEIICPKIYFAPGFEFHKNRYSKKERGKVIWYAGGLIDWNNVLTSHRGVDEVDKGQYNKSEEIDLATGCAMFVNAEVFKQIGFFDPIYFAYFEDADFSIQAKKNGFKIFFSPKAILWHKNASSFKGSGSDFQDYFITRNRIIFGLRYAPIRAKFALLRESIKFIFQRSRIKRQAVIDAILRRVPNIKLINNMIG